MSDAADGGGSVSADPGEIAVPASHGAGVPAPAAPAEVVAETVSAPESVAPVPEATKTEVALPEVQEAIAVETPATPRSELRSTTGEASPPPPPAPDPTPQQAPPPPPTETPIKSRLGAAFEKLRFNKRAKLDKIVQLAAKKGRIKNDDVEKLLRISDSTAGRYLTQLVREGRLKRVGKPEVAVYEQV